MMWTFRMSSIRWSRLTKRPTRIYSRICLILSFSRCTWTMLIRCLCPREGSIWLPSLVQWLHLTRLICLRVELYMCIQKARFPMGLYKAFPKRLKINFGRTTKQTSLSKWRLEWLLNEKSIQLAKQLQSVTIHLLSGRRVIQSQVVLLSLWKGSTMLRFSRRSCQKSF